MLPSTPSQGKGSPVAGIAGRAAGAGDGEAAGDGRGVAVGEWTVTTSGAGVELGRPGSRVASGVASGVGAGLAVGRGVGSGRATVFTKDACPTGSGAGSAVPSGPATRTKPVRAALRLPAPSSVMVI